MDDKEYETVTAALYQAMGESSGITIECFGSSCRVQGKSGSWYQIDVLTGRLVRHAGRLVFQLAEVLVSREMLGGILERIGRLRLAPG